MQDTHRVANEGQVAGKEDQSPGSIHMEWPMRGRQHRVANEG